LGFGDGAGAGAGGGPLGAKAAEIVGVLAREFAAAPPGGGAVSARGAPACVRACVRACVSCAWFQAGGPYGHAVDALVLIFQDVLGRPAGWRRTWARSSQQ
jgi:hypothetical protein